MSNKIKWMTLLLAISLSFSGCNGAEATNSTIALSQTIATEIAEGLEQATFVRAVDGDTLRVTLEGTEYAVRLIGVNTPESVHADESKNTEAGKTASEHTKALLEEGQILYLEKDVSDTDKYGRLLRYVWLTVPENPEDEEEIRAKMLNTRLLSDGYANAYKVGKDTKNYDLFCALELEAYEKKVGLWAEEGNLSTQTVEKQIAKQETLTIGDGEYRYIGNGKSKKYHALTCGNLPAEDNRVYFESKAQAEEAEYLPCGSCKP